MRVQDGRLMQQVLLHHAKEKETIMRIMRMMRMMQMDQWWSMPRRSKGLLLEMVVLEQPVQVRVLVLVEVLR